jgi:hypothetical protein
MLELGNGYAVVGGGMVRSSNEIRRESCLWPGLNLVSGTPGGALVHQLQAAKQEIRFGGAKQLISRCKMINTINSRQSHHSSYEAKTT